MTDEIELHTLPPVWGSPSPSPFAIKLATWLRMAGIPYRTVVLTRPARSVTGKIPYVRLADGRILHDSGLVAASLTRERGVTLDDGLDPHQLALGHAVRRMLEESTYFLLLVDRWVSHEGFRHTRADYFAHLPWPLRTVFPRILRRRIVRYVHGQGYGRHPRDVRAAMAGEDFGSLAALLGDRPYFHGRPTSIDAAMTGFLWAAAANPFPSVVGDALRAEPTLLAHLDRMRSTWWAGFDGSG